MYLIKEKISMGAHLGRGVQEGKGMVEVEMGSLAVETGTMVEELVLEPAARMVLQVLEEAAMGLELVELVEAAMGLELVELVAAEMG